MMRSWPRACRYLATQARQPVAHYEHTEIGYNYRLSNLLAALGRAQLSRLDGMIGRRRGDPRPLPRLLRGRAGCALFGETGDEADNCWLTSVVVDPVVAGWAPSDLSSALAEDEIESRPLWKPMHLQPVFADARVIDSGVSQRLFEQGLTLPSGSVLEESDIDRVLARIEGFLPRTAR